MEQVALGEWNEMSRKENYYYVGLLLLLLRMVRMRLTAHKDRHAQYLTYCETIIREACPKRRRLQRLKGREWGVVGVSE